MDASVEVRHIVFFLNDAIGEELLVRMERTPEKVTFAETLAALCRFEGSGALSYPWNAKSIEDALRARDGKEYRLLGVRVLPNHVHVLLEAAPTWPLGDPIHRWKTASSPRRKDTPRPGLERCGPDRLRPRALRLEQPRPDEFWADEDFERVLRTAQELEDARRLMDRISPPSRTPAPSPPEDEADISPPSPLPSGSPTEPQPAVVQRRPVAQSAKSGRLRRFMREVRECASDLAVLYGWYFFAVGLVALLQQTLGRWGLH
ncbi:MAG TPA: hypothetical protein VK801_07465 [Caulobacteraceae bacterium]|nr:hypothetical protein [Caulobacteraceae bacterium]